MEPTQRVAIVLGATGLIGGHLVRLLERADSGYARVTALSRRASNRASDRVREVVVDFDAPASYQPFLGVDDVFCCLGTTIKQAGSQAAFRKVDCEIPVLVARTAFAAGARKFLIVTAVGANKTSAVFYNRVKGETEDALASLAFPEGVHVFHPSVLLGERDEPRPGEGLAAGILSATRPIFVGPLLRYRAIDASDVASALYNVARGTSDAAMHVYEGRELFDAVKMDART